MQDAQNILFNTSLGLQIDTNGIIKEVIKFMSEEPEREYMITIGTDSVLYEKTKADFITAIVVHRIGNGGRYFWRRVELDKFHTLRDRILKEALLSLDIAKEVLSKLRDLKVENFGFEIHVDVGERGETKNVIQEVVGLVRAMNYEVKTKPYSYAASSIADRHA